MRVMPYGDPNAHGTIGKTITFIRRRGITYGKPWKSPYNPNTAGQQTQRSDFKSAVTAWQTSSNETRYYFDQRAIGQNYTGYNLFISKYLLGELPSQVPLQSKNLRSMHIGTLRSTDPDGWLYNLNTIVSSTKLGLIYDNENIYDDKSIAPALEDLCIEVVENKETINVILRDTISLQVTLALTVVCYLPDITADVLLFPADDGSTYFDQAFTQLACASTF